MLAAVCIVGGVWGVKGLCSGNWAPLIHSCAALSQVSTTCLASPVIPLTWFEPHLKDSASLLPLRAPGGEDLLA